MGKRFAVFTFNQYYPRGGPHDLDGFFDSFDEAKNRAIELLNEWDYSTVLDFERLEYMEYTIRTPGEVKEAGPIPCIPWSM